MPVDIVIPQAGESVTTGVLSRWLKADGDHVKRDEDVLELETDKVNLGVPAPATGLLRISVKAGATVKIGQVVGAVDEKVGSTGGASTPPIESSPPKAVVTSEPKAGMAAGAGNGVAVSQVVGADVRATPLARKLAEEHGIDLRTVQGTGAGGRVREQDVLDRVSLSSGATATLAATPAQPPGAPAIKSTGVRRERLSPLRQRIAARLVEAQHTAAMLTTFNECDMSAVMAARAEYKEAFEKKHGVGLGFMSFFAKAVVGALRAYPSLNASIVSAPDGSMEVEHHESCDIAFAVSTPKGLTVPVLRGVDRLSFAKIEAGIKELAIRARDGKLALADLQGGTFTITNGGIYGSLMSTPILNPPQSGILGMHTIKSRPIEHPAGSGQVAIRPMMYLALSYDHRLVDGAEAVQFLIAVKNAIEDPKRLLLEV